MRHCLAAAPARAPVTSLGRCYFHTLTHLTPFSLPIRATLLVPPPLLPLLPSMPPPPTNHIRSGQAKGRVFRDSSLFLPHITCVRMKRSGSYAGRIERCCWSSAAPPHPSPIERMRWNRAHQHATGRTQDSGRCWSFARPHPHPHSADSVHLLTSSRALLGPEAIRECLQVLARQGGLELTTSIPRKQGGEAGAESKHVKQSVE
ncbi:hypothetical protein BS78_K105200 [Paspalum vaginatum]|uniref:Uncharacterized protein n=1 Tax=Paspalum vaginatum TaxID=158149 RepID=A0A9W7X8T1_9POAL|nr:hypothetical protein BS78_K105200 [Paspalum vaginatum]